MNELIRKAVKDTYKEGPLNFGAQNPLWERNVGGVNYLSSTAGTQSFNASALVSR